MYDDFIRYKGVEWSLPLLFQYEPVYPILHRRFTAIDIRDMKVNLFGSPACLWSGGRKPSVYGELNTGVLMNVFRYCKLFNATPTLTFTSTNILNEDLRDEYCNLILELALEAGARFIVFEDRLRDYIKSKNPEAIVVASVIKSIFEFQDPENIKDATVEKETLYYNKLLKDYDIVVVRPEYSKKALLYCKDEISDLSRLEVLINQTCAYNCPKATEHYRSYELVKEQDGPLPFTCFMHDIKPKIQFEYENTCVHDYSLVKELVDNGIKHLKLQGRGASRTMETVAYLLYTQMFKTTGSGYSVLENSMDDLEQEIEYFHKFIF